VTLGPSKATTGFLAGQSQEIVAERTERSTVFANPDGTKTARQFSEHTFARNRDGAMVPIDTKLAPGSDRRLRPAAAMDVSFAEQAADAQLATMTVAPGLTAGFGLAGAAPVAGQVDGSRVVYPNVHPDADLIVTATPDGLKVELIVKSADSPTRWVFRLTLSGLTLQLSAETKPAGPPGSGTTTPDRSPASQPSGGRN